MKKLVLFFAALVLVTFSWQGIAMGQSAFNVPLRAGDTLVPYFSKMEDRTYLGTGLFYESGVPFFTRTALNEEVLIVLRLTDMRKPAIWENGKQIPQVIEVRKFVPNTFYHQLPLLRIMWSEGNHGLADYISVVVGYKPDGTPIFETHPIRESKPRMADTWYFETARKTAQK